MRKLNENARVLAAYFVLVAQFLVVNFLFMAPAVVAVPISMELHLTPGQIGLVGSTFFYTYAFVQIPTGLLLARYGIRRTATLSAILMSAGSLLFGLSTSYLALTASRALIGLGAGMIFIPLLGFINLWFPPDRFGRFFGIALGVSSPGLLLATLPLSFIVEREGWRLPSFLVAATCAVLLLLDLLFIRERQPPNLTGKGETKSQRELLQYGFRMWFSHRSLVIFSVLVFCITGSLNAFQGLWVGPYAQSVLGLQGTPLGWFLLLMPIGTIGSHFMAGFASDFLARKKPVIVTGCVVYALVWLSLAMSVEGRLIWYPFIAVTLLASVRGPVHMGYGLIGRFVPSEIEGVVTGIANTMFHLGGAVFQMLLGFIMDSRTAGVSQLSVQGFGAGFLFISVVAAMCMFLSFLLQDPPDQLPSQQYRPSDRHNADDGLL